MIEIDNNKVSELKKSACKEIAKKLLLETDWSELPTASNQLENLVLFQTYRNEIRKYIINPVEDPIFPVEPNPIWSK